MTREDERVGVGSPGRELPLGQVLREWAKKRDGPPLRGLGRSDLPEGHGAFDQQRPVPYMAPRERQSLARP